MGEDESRAQRVIFGFVLHAPQRHGRASVEATRIQCRPASHWNIRQYAGKSSTVFIQADSLPDQYHRLFKRRRVRNPSFLLVYNGLGTRWFGLSALGLEWRRESWGATPGWHEFGPLARSGCDHPPHGRCPRLVFPGGRFEATGVECDPTMSARTSRREPKRTTGRGHENILPGSHTSTTQGGANSGWILARCARICHLAEILLALPVFFSHVWQRSTTVFAVNLQPIRKMWSRLSGEILFWVSAQEVVP